MKTFIELLRNSGYPTSYIQGHHTRIVFYESAFEVYQKSTDNRYTISLYLGDCEEEAVRYYLKSEEE